MREIGWVAYSYKSLLSIFLFAVLRLSNHFIEIPHNDFVRMFYETISTAGTKKRSRRFKQFAYIKLSYIIAIFFPSLADSKRAFLALSVGNPSGGCQFQPHGNLTPALSPGHSRVSIIIPPACHRHRRVLSPTVGLSSYGSPISRQRKCCTGSIGIRLSKISLAQPVTKKIRLPGATLCNACPIWSRRLLNVLKIPCITACSSAVSVSDTYSSRTSWESVKYFLPRRKPSAIRTPPFVLHLRVIGQEQERTDRSL